LPNQAAPDTGRQAVAPYQEELSTVVDETATALNRATTLETTMDNFLLQALLESAGGKRQGGSILLDNLQRVRLN